ncbi:MAG: Stp1/IreP family PP2C-type Ser/Thr phosphatase [Firmicutes bacterium]|nr:Stp1/IreP family PP2C-type Ser/Thr phosphatase [Candidatus Fermentithermobacillaceae bacterium]
MRWKARSSQGLVRSENQDSWSVNRLARPDGEEAWLAVVADGIGGREGGQIASSLAVQSVVEFFTRSSWNDGPVTLLTEAMNHANASVFQAGSADSSITGMGTTLTCVLVCQDESRAFIGHVGDSRVYIVSFEQIRRVTDDHSVSGELLKRGAITEEDAMNHPNRNVLTAALGTQASLQFSLYEERLLPDDVIVLCTDGLTSLVSAEEIRRTILDCECEDVAGELVNLANSRGGYDNVTVVLLWPEIPDSSHTTRGEAE